MGKDYAADNYPGEKSTTSRQGYRDDLGHYIQSPNMTVTGILTVIKGGRPIS